ncbi:MAG: CHASE2 domain-containing protein [Treponema sp.]|nr:CHASE2 domain-containing protein [Treponema sp.]
MKKVLPFFIPVLAVLICSLLRFSTLDMKAADIFQKISSSPVERENILLVSVDNKTLDEIGTWPLPRNVYGDFALTYKELGGKDVVFDLSFLDASKKTLDETYLQGNFYNTVDDIFQFAAAQISDVMTNYSGDEEELEAAIDTSISVLQNTQDEVLSEFEYLINSADDVFANALSVSKNTYLTLTFDNESIPADEEIQMMEERFAIKNITVLKDTVTPEYTGVIPAIPVLISQAKNAGFVNADSDSDGFLRRIHLLNKYNDKYYGQLIFVPLLEQLGNPELVVSNKSIVLKNARFNGTTKDIVIPRCEDGSVLVRYPKKQFEEYNNASFYYIWQIKLLEENFFANLCYMNDSGYFDSLSAEENPVELYNNALYELENSSDDYFLYKKQFYEALKKVFNKHFISDLAEEYSDDEELYDQIIEDFDVVSEEYTNLIDARKEVAETIKNATCIIGTSSTSSSDFGTILYETLYPNSGVHYALANQILSEDFIDDIPFVYSLLVALIISMLFFILAHRIKSSIKIIIFGLLSVIVVFAGSYTYFHFTHQYPLIVVPVASLIFTFISVIIIKYSSESRNRKFIQDCFSQCLNPDVVKDIIKDPTCMKLGGEKRTMTAIFTDIQRFSTISEVLSASELVALLNYYLTKMSDIIMDERGTVDKYEGDAIVALVGAPLDMTDHATRACAAALKMKRAEAKMNEDIKRYASSAKPADFSDDLYNAFKILVEKDISIFTRIGINSGDIVAGFMGSEKKKNYTMMGNNVNLASRLEGANKQYSTGGILVSEATKALTDDIFVFRRLDKVQVLNVNTPIQLYELVNFKRDASKDELTLMAVWDKTMKVFEKGHYSNALANFKKFQTYRPKDKVCAYYISLLENFFTNGKYPSEADDIGVAYNSEGPLKGTFKLLQK